MKSLRERWANQSADDYNFTDTGFRPTYKPSPDTIVTDEDREDFERMLKEYKERHKDSGRD